MNPTSRRQFLRTGAPAAAAVYQLSASVPVQSHSHPAASDSVNLGFIGSGIRGKQLIDEFLEVKGARGIAVADLYDGCLVRGKEQLGETIQTTKDYRAILDNKDVDAVVIATPDHWHERIVLDALSAGKHVYCEKPLTWSIPEGQRIMTAVANAKRVLQVGSQGKTSALTAKAKEIVASGALGKVTMIRMANHRNSAEGAWVYPIPPDASEKTIDWPRFIGRSPRKAFDPKIFFRWRCWWEYSGGVATDLFVHQFTTMHEIMGVKGPTSAVTQGMIARWKDGRSVPDVMNSLVEYPEGFIVDISVNQANSVQPRGIQILGTESSLQLGGNRLIVIPEPKQSEAQHYGSLNFPRQLREEYLAKFANEERSPRPEPNEITVERGPSHNWFFIDSILNGKPSRENAEEGHHAAGAAHLCNLAYRKGGKAQWDLTTNRVRV